MDLRRVLQKVFQNGLSAALRFNAWERVWWTN